MPPCPRPLLDRIQHRYAAMIEITEQIAINPCEIEESFVRASGPGTNIPKAAGEILRLISDRQASAAA